VYDQTDETPHRKHVDLPFPGKAWIPATCFSLSRMQSSLHTNHSVRLAKFGNLACSRDDIAKEKIVHNSKSNPGEDAK
jgi:hypothetical protein